MTAVTGAFVDASDEAAIEAQILSLAVAAPIIISIGSKVYIGKLTT